MAARETSPATRLRALARSKEQAALFKRGEVLSALPMSELLGVHWNTLSAWCKDVPGFASSGCFQGGNRGVEYRFHPMKTVNYLIRYFEKERDKRAAKQNRVRKIVGGGALAEVPDEFSLDDLNKMIALSIKVQDQLERQGKLVDAEKVVTALTAAFSAIQQAAMRAAMEQDVNGQWPADVRESFENATRNMLTVIERAARECLSTLSPS